MSIQNCLLMTKVRKINVELLASSTEVVVKEEIWRQDVQSDRQQL